MWLLGGFGAVVHPDSRVGVLQLKVVSELMVSKLYKVYVYVFESLIILKTEKSSKRDVERVNRTLGSCVMHNRVSIAYEFTVGESCT